MSLLLTFRKAPLVPPPAPTPLTPASAPALVVEIAFEGYPASDPPTTPAYVDVTDYLRSWGLRRGRQRVMDRTEAGIATLVLDNQDRRFDSSWELGPYYPDVKPMRPMRIMALVVTGATPFSVRSSYVGGGHYLRGGDVMVPMFTGYVTSWRQDFPGRGFDAVVTASCVDAFGPMSFSPVGTIPYSAFDGTTESLNRRDPEFAGTRIGAILDADTNSGVGGGAYWPLRRLDEGWLFLETYQQDDFDTAILGLLQETAAADGGIIYIARDGAVVFRDGQTRNPPPGYEWAPPDVPDGHLFGEGGQPIATFATDDNEDLIYNHVTVTNGAGDTWTTGTEDQTSMYDYFRRSLSITSLVYGPSNVHQVADLYWSYYKDPHPAIVELSLRPADWLLVLQRDLWDKVRVKVRMPNDSIRTQDSLIEGIAIDSPNRYDWRVTWRLSAA